MRITNRDVFAVSWQGGGGWGDRLERDLQSVDRDVAAGLVSTEAAKQVYGVVLNGGKVDVPASEERRRRVRLERVGSFDQDASKFIKGPFLGAIGESLFLARDEKGFHVVTKAGYLLASNHTRWRSGARAVVFDSLPNEYGIMLHEKLSVTAYYCPATGTLLWVDVHERGNSRLTMSSSISLRQRRSSKSISPHLKRRLTVDGGVTSISVW